MKVDRNSAKFISRVLLVKTKPSVIINTALYIIMTTAIYNLVFSLSGYYNYMIEFVTYFKTTGEYYTGEFPQISSMAISLCFALVVLKIILDAGYEVYTLMVSRGMKTDFKALFSGFDFPIKAIVMFVVKNVVIAVGFALFIIPGVILHYSYRFSFFVLADNPEYPVLKCLSESSKIAKGNIMQLFMLDVSLLGWKLLSWIIAYFFLPVLDIWVRPYTGISFAVFYNILSNKATTVKIIRREDGSQIISIVPSENIPEKNSENTEETGTEESEEESKEDNGRDNAESGENDNNN